MQPLQYYLRDPAAKDKNITHAAAAPSNLDAATTTLFAASRRKPAHIYAHGNTKWQQSCSHSTAICNNRFKTRIELRTQEQPLVAEHRGGTHSRMKRPQPHPPHTRGTFHRRLQPLDTEKHKVSCSGFLPKTKPIEHSCSHYNAFCSITWLTCTYLRTWQHQMTTIIGTATRCRTQRRNTFAHETTPAAPAAHTRYLSSPPAATLHGKTQGFVLHLPPQNKAHATFMRPLQCVLPRRKPARIYAHGNTRWQQSCSHSTAICNSRFNTRIELRTQAQPLVAEHRGGTHSRMKRSQPHPPHTRGTFHRRLQPLYTEKHKVSCSGFLPKTKPIEHSCSHYNAFCSITWLTCTYLRTWQHQMTTIIGTATRCRTQRRNTFAHETIPAAPAAHTRYLSSPAAATWHGKTQGFVLWLPPQNKAHWAFIQPLQCVSQHHFSSSPLPFVTTSQSHHTPFVTTSQSHHFPSSPLPVLTTSLHSLLFFCDVLLHRTTLHRLSFFCDVLLQVKVIRNSEDCFPTSFDK